MKTKGSCKLHVDAGGEDWRHWKNLVENRFTKETTCLAFHSMPDFPQFLATFICSVCKTDEAGTDFLNTFFTFNLNFRNFEDWIIFRSESSWFSIEICVIVLLTAWTV